MAKSLETQQVALVSGVSPLRHATGPRAASLQHMNSSCLTQRVSIIDRPARQGQASRSVSPLSALAAAAQGGLGGQASAHHGRGPHSPCSTLPSADFRAPPASSPLNHHSDRLVSAHFKYGQREKGICLPEVGETPAVLILGFPEPFLRTYGQGLATGQAAAGARTLARVVRFLLSEECSTHLSLRCLGPVRWCPMSVLPAATTRGRA